MTTSTPENVRTKSYEAKKNGRLLKVSNVSTLKDNRPSGEASVYNITADVSKESAVDVPGEEEKIEGDLEYKWGVSIPGVRPVNTTEQTLSDEVDAVRELASLEPTHRNVSWKSFIEEEYVSAPLLCSETWTNDKDVYFGGDNRSFQQDSTTYRLWAGAVFNFHVPKWDYVDGKFEFGGWREPSIYDNRSVGETKLYEKNSDGSMTLLDAATAPRSDIEVTAEWISETSGSAVIEAHSPNPLCSVGGVFDAPTIDHEAGITVTKDDSFELVGSHTAAPSHEIYLNTMSNDITSEPTFDDWNPEEGKNTTCLLLFENRGFTWLALPQTSVTITPPSYEELHDYPGCSATA